MKRITVFAGSKHGTRPAYRAGAESLGLELARRGIGLVYGGGSVGLMGVLADAVLGAGGEVVGVIPGALATRELVHKGVTHLHVVGSMHERKALMAELSDAFVALPGGYGTFEELLEIVTWAQLGVHRKPVGVLDVAGYFSPLLAVVDHAIDEGFIESEQRALFVARDDPESLLAALDAFEPVDVPEWLTKRWT